MGIIGRVLGTARRTATTPARTGRAGRRGPVATTRPAGARSGGLLSGLLRRRGL